MVNNNYFDFFIFMVIVFFMIANAFGERIPEWVILASVGYCLTRIAGLNNIKEVKSA